MRCSAPSRAKDLWRVLLLIIYDLPQRGCLKHCDCHNVIFISSIQIYIINKFIYIHIYSPYQLLQDLVVHEWLVIKLIVLQGHMLPSLIRCLHLFHCPTALGWHNHAEQNERLELHKTSRHAVGARCLKLFTYDNILSGVNYQEKQKCCWHVFGCQSFSSCWLLDSWPWNVNSAIAGRTHFAILPQTALHNTALHVYLTVRQHCKSLLAIWYICI